MWCTWLALTTEDGQGEPEWAGDAMKVLVANLQTAIRRALGRWGCVALLGPALTACAGLQVYDLDQAVHHFSQTDAAARWGSPESVMALPAGQNTLDLYGPVSHDRPPWEADGDQSWLGGGRGRRVYPISLPL